MSLAVEPFELELRRPLSTAAGEIRERRGLLVRVEAAGVVGVGEATPLPGWTESLETCREALERAAAVAPAWESALARVDDAPAARHGLSLALADARARAADTPLATHLVEGPPADTVAVNATVGDGSPEETADAVVAATGEGYGTVKLKVGIGPVDRDVERVRAARTRSDATLRADANGAWDRSGAEQFLDAVGDELEYVEQPLPAAELGGLAALRTRGSVAVDESLAERGVDAALAADAADVYVLKPMALGGLDRTLAAGRAVRAAGASVVVTTTIDAVVARTAAVHLAAALRIDRACGLGTADLLAADLGPDPTPVERGEIRLSDRAGLGIDPDDVFD